MPDRVVKLGRRSTRARSRGDGTSRREQALEVAKAGAPACPSSQTGGFPGSSRCRKAENRRPGEEVETGVPDRLRPRSRRSPASPRERDPPQGLEVGPAKKKTFETALMEKAIACMRRSAGRVGSQSGGGGWAGMLGLRSEAGRERARLPAPARARSPKAAEDRRGAGNAEQTAPRRFPHRRPDAERVPRRGSEAEAHGGLLNEAEKRAHRPGARYSARFPPQAARTASRASCARASRADGKDRGYPPSLQGRRPQRPEGGGGNGRPQRQPTR